jgi:hypothetical protein
MDTIFKNVSHINETIRSYELKDILQGSEWDKKISSMFEHMDLAVLEKCWTSILYDLPLTIVMIGDKSDKDKVILDNFREVDALMAIYGFHPRGEKLYLDPMSCELVLEKGDGFITLPDVCDTVKMLQTIEKINLWNISEDVKTKVIDNIKNINKKLQRAEILFHELMVGSYERSRLANVLEQFYKDLYAYI